MKYTPTYPSLRAERSNPLHDERLLRREEHPPRNDEIMESGGSLMYTETEMRSLYQCFARMLEYPAGKTLQAAALAEGLLRSENPKAAALLKEFHDYAQNLPVGRLEEVYTGTFDLDAACQPYIGYHLFGETYKRSAFMIELKERYRAHGFEPPANELPDHLSVMLHFIALAEDRVLADELVHDALLPVLERMTGRAKSSGFDEDEDSPTVETTPEKRHQFQTVLEALRLVSLGQAHPVQA